MNRLHITSIASCFFVFSFFNLLYAQGLSTSWGSALTADQAWQQYPRPQMVRSGWQNLNGLWDYAILPVANSQPERYEGKIRVPFAVESALSKVKRRVGKDSVLWYRTTFQTSAAKNKKLLLHFGAVDWATEVWINGKSAGKHEGGYDPFYFDITSYLNKGKDQELLVKVWDPSDDGPQPRGKQVKSPHSIWYTPVTGIWQTVWLESVSPLYIQKINTIPDIDNKSIDIRLDIPAWRSGDKVTVSVWDGKTKLQESSWDTPGGMLQIAQPHLWSTEDPFLYGLRITVQRNGKVSDEVESYFAMRKISVGKDAQGMPRLMLNNKFVFQYGPLDQGWWPDGLYTAPSDEALEFDIIKTKQMGFNMIRKHVKVEPARWYYHCDVQGMLVWQDMPSGDMGNRWDSRPGIIGVATERERSAESESIFRKEWRAIMDALQSFPCIVVWVPFNEGWGQFRTKEIVNWTKQYDPTRLVNEASGGNYYYSGDMIDLHNYPEPCMPDPNVFGKDLVFVLGEYGGLGLPVEGHTWQAKNNWGYQSFSNRDELWEKYHSFIGRLANLIPQGLSAAVYTQTTDVEIEVNGLMTYDRKVLKMDPEKLASAHRILFTTK